VEASVGHVAMAGKESTAKDYWAGRKRNLWATKGRQRLQDMVVPLTRSS